MKKITISIFLLAFVLPGTGQKTATNKPAYQYTGTVSGALVTGANGYSYSVQTLQGIKNGSWMLGLGIGADEYVVPGFPLVAHGQYWVGKQKAKPFLYAQAGPVFPWKKNEWDAKIMGKDQYEMHTGWLAEGGIGYQWPLGKRMALFTNAGYSIKQARYDALRFNWFDTGWPITNTGDTYSFNKLTMNRVTLKLGVVF